jgi:nicotinate-nucleotide pyrophosphorylase (carboxylating)
VKLLDTRKTFPRARFLQKYAVRAGGGWNHRRGLYDMVLLKENHLAAAGGITPAVNACRKKYRNRFLIGVEVTNPVELREALAAGAGHILIDNAPPGRLAAWMKLPEVLSSLPRVTFEASGGITARNLAAYGKTGVDFISLGCLTHSVKNSDYSLLLEKTSPQRTQRSQRVKGV